MKEVITPLLLSKKFCTEYRKIIHHQQDLLKKLAFYCSILTLRLTHTSLPPSSFLSRYSLPLRSLSYQACGRRPGQSEGPWIHEHLLQVRLDRIGFKKPVCLWAGHVQADNGTLNSGLIMELRPTTWGTSEWVKVATCIAGTFYFNCEFFPISKVRDPTQKSRIIHKKYSFRTSIYI